MQPLLKAPSFRQFPQKETPEKRHHFILKSKKLTNETLMKPMKWQLYFFQRKAFKDLNCNEHWTYSVCKTPLLKKKLVETFEKSATEDLDIPVRKWENWVSSGETKADSLFWGRMALHFTPKTPSQRESLI